MKIDELRKLITLDAGSHNNPRYGVCVNEAAIVVAGLKYKAVEDEFPRCFSQPLAKILLELNDFITDNERQALVPFTVRLAGSRDVKRVEQKRLKHIWFRLIGLEKAKNYRQAELILKKQLGSRNPSEVEELRVLEVIRQGSLNDAADCLFEMGYCNRSVLVEAINEAFDIGRQAPPIETACIIARVEALKHWVVK